MDLRGLRYFVTVAEERNVGRAAARLHMTQPPLSRALRHLEAELGATLLERTRTGVELTEAGHTLHAEALSLLEQADRLASRVRDVAGHATLAVGTLADTAELVGGRLIAEFRHRHPHVAVTVHEAGLADPSAGLRAGLVDVALTRLPFDDTGLRSHVLHSEPIGIVLRADDPLARRDGLRVADLTDRRWVRLAEATDPIWSAYWNSPTTRPDPATPNPVTHTIQECLQAVLWNGMSALAPLDQVLPAGLVTVPVTDREPSRLVLAWPANAASPLVRSLVRVAADTYRRT